MIQAYGDYQNMVNKTNQAEGTTLANQEKYAESLKGRLQELKTVWEDIGFNATPDNKSILGVLLGGATGISKAIKNFGLLGSAITSVVAVTSLRGGGPLSNVGPIDGTNKYGIYKGGLFNIKGMFQRKSILSDSDLDALNLYNEKVKAGVLPTQAFSEAMGGASSTAQGYARSAMKAAESTGKATVAMEQIPKVSRAVQIGMTLASTAINVGLTIALSLVVKGIIHLAQASEEMSRKAAEATSKFKEQNESIEDYKTKITDLRKSLGDQNITYEDARSKREELLNIQKELIKSYGSEAQGIDLVNGSLDEQIKKLDEVNAKKRQEWINEAGGLGSLKKVANKVENFSKTVEFGDNVFINNPELKKLFTSFGNIEFISDKKIKVSGDVESVIDAITRIRSEVIGSRQDMEYLDEELQKIYDKAKNIYDENWDTYQTYLQTQILDDETGLDYYGKLTEAYKKYKEAKTSGNEQAVKEATNEYSDLLTGIEEEIANGNMPESFKKYFEDMYPDMVDIVSKWKFEINITPKIDNNEGNIQSDIDKLKGFTTEEIVAAFQSGGAGVTPDQMTAISNLNKLASENGMTFEGFLEQLRNKKYLMNQADKDTADYINKFVKKSSENNSVLKDEYQKIQDWGLSDFADDIKSGTIQTVFGNVDMDKRTIITWSDELKKTYQDQLKSWEYDPEIGTIDTVFGGSDKFGEALNGLGWEIAFTPILPDGTFLSKEAVYNYINTILTEAYSDDGKVTEDELKSIDSQGRQIGNVFIQGIFAGMDESEDYSNNGNKAELSGRLMHFAGKYGAINLAKENYGDREILQNFFEKNHVSPDKFKEIVGGITDVTEAINKYNAAMDEADKPRFGDTVKSISTLEEQLSSLDAAYADLIDATDETPGKISFESLKKINDAFGGLELEGYEDFMKTISKSGVTAKEVKDALDKLTSEYLDQSDALKNLTDDNKDLVISMLKEKGIANAEQIVMDKLAIKTAEATLEKGILADMSDKTEREVLDEVDAFIKEGNYSEYAATMIRRFALQKQFAEGVKLRNQDDINYLIEIARTAGASAKVLDDFQKVKTYMGLNGWRKAQLSKEERDQMESLKESIQNGTYTLDFNAVNIPTNFTGGTDTQKALDKNKEAAKKLKDAYKDYNKSMQEAQKSLEKLNKEEIAENTKYSIDLVNESLERIGKTISSIEEAVDGLFEKDYLGKINLTKDAMANAVSYGEDLRAEFERLSAIEPQSAQEAQDLASAMEGLGDKIRQNYRDLIEYRSNLTKLRVEGLVSIGEDASEINEQFASMLDRNLKIFKGEGGFGKISFDLLPTIPKSAVEKQRAENNALINEEQRYQNEIAEIKRTALAMQKAENEQARAEERAKIAEDMAEAKAKLEEAIAEAKGIQDTGVAQTKESMDAVSEAQKEFDQKVKEEQSSANTQITTELQNTLTNTTQILQTDITTKIELISGFINDIKSQFTDLATFIASNPIEMPSMDGTDSSGNKYIDLAKSYIGKVKYVYGGDNLETGTDCSGFTQAIYGLKERDTAGQMASSEGTKVSLSDLQPGDQVFLSSSGSPSGRHTGIYVGDGKMISNRGKEYGVQLHGFDSDKFLMAKRYALGNNGAYSGIALVGDDKDGKLNKIRPELIVGRNGVRLVGINGAEFVNLEEGERVLPYEVTRRVLTNSNINFPRYAGGYTVSIPKNYGKTYTYMGWQKITSKSSDQYKLREAAGMNFDSEGYGIINGRKVIATTPKMGKVGDYVNVVLADGSVIQAIIGDMKNTNDRGANEYGHDNGSSVVEFIVDKPSWYGKKDNPQLPKTISIENLGQNYFNSTSATKNFDTLVGISEDTSKILSLLGTEVSLPLTQAYNEQGGEGERFKASFEKRSAEYSKWLNDLADGIGYQPKGSSKKFTADELLNAMKGKNINLDGIISDSDEIVKNIGDSLEYVMFESYKSNSELLQMQYKDASERYRLLIEDYNAALEAGASATDLEIIRENLSKMDEEKKSLSDQLTSSLESVYGIFQNRLEREVSVIEDRLRIQEELNGKLERQAGLTDDVVRQYDILSEQIKINSEKATIYEDQKNTAHRLRTEYQQLIETDPAFKWLTDRVDLESLFNTDGKINSLGQYYISAINQTEEFAGQGARLANILETIESAKTMWAEASTAQEEVMWDSYEKSKEQIDLKVNEYLKGQEALIEKLEYQENKQRTLIDLQSKEYDLLAKIRDKRREITSEYQASLDSYGWLDADTRETLFNDNDYKMLTDKLDDVQKKVVNLHSNYRKQISELSRKDWYKQTEITNEYQRQYDILMETYELAEKEVELSKKRIEYQNIANNKNMRILQGNTWVQTPDIAKMYEAAKELKNAEQESLDTQMTMNEAQIVRNMETYADMLNTQISGVQASIETIQDMTEEEKKFFASNLADIKELTRYYIKLNAEGETSPNLSAKVSKEVTGTDLTVPSKVATDVNTTYALPSNFTGAYGTVIAGDKTTKTVNDNLDGVETDNIIKPYTEPKTDNVPDRSTWKEIPINPKLAAIFGGASIMQHAGNIAVEGLKMTLKNMTGNTYNNKENTVSNIYSINTVEVNQPTDSLIELLDVATQVVMQKIIKK